jgi:TRAP-type C4-dicarboxylate transport system substrate-binding protein
MSNRRTLAAMAGALIIAAPALAQQPMVLKLNSPAPPPSYLHTTTFTPWAENVSKASDGAIKVQTFYGGTLGNFAVTYDRVVDGVADIGFILTAFAAGKFKQQDVAALPFEASTSSAASNALWKLYEKGVTAGEFDAVRPLAIWTFPNAAIHSKEPVRSLSDLKGKKIVASNVIAGKIIVNLGGTPVTFRPDEAYQAISRGTADAALMPFTGMAVFKINEVTRHHADVPLGSDSALLFINKKKYESLPPKAKAAIDKYSYLTLSQQLGKRTDSEWADKRGLVKDRIVTLNAPEAARWKKALAPIAEEWARETPNGAKVLAAFREEVKAYETAKK